jgi:ATP synthase protein I
MADKPILKNLLHVSSIGIHMVACTFAGLAIGYGIDKLFNTPTWFTIIFLILGIIAGFVELIRLAKRKFDEDDDKKNL